MINTTSLLECVGFEKHSVGMGVSVWWTEQIMGGLQKGEDAIRAKRQGIKGHFIRTPATNLEKIHVVSCH